MLINVSIASYEYNFPSVNDGWILSVVMKDHMGCSSQVNIESLL